MNTETIATHDALVAVPRGPAGRPLDGNKDRLLADLKVLAADTEQLIREAAAASNEGYTELRARFDTKLVDAKAKLVQARAAVAEQSRQARAATHTYVKGNPWQAAGFAAAAGVLFGYLLSRRIG